MARIPGELTAFLLGLNFDREGQAFCSAANLKQLDTCVRYEQMGQTPDLSEEAGQAVRFK